MHELIIMLFVVGYHDNVSETWEFLDFAVLCFLPASLAVCLLVCYIVHQDLGLFDQVTHG